MAQMCVSARAATQEKKQMKAGWTLVLILIVFVTMPMFAQAPIAAREQGVAFTETETLQGELQSAGNVVKLDSTVGYDFSKRWGVFLGVPLYFTGGPGSTTAAGTSSGQGSAGLGNIYLGIVFRAPNPALNYASTLTFAAPTGSVSAGRSSGRASLDWSNYFDRSFGRTTPFVDAGLSNTVPDTRLITEPFTSLGLVSHFQEGASVDLVRHFSVGGLAYQIVPFGDQQVFSKLVERGSNSGPGSASSGGSSSGSSGDHGRDVFRQQFFSSGSGLTRENGATAWVGFQPSSYWSAQVGVSRSITYAYTSAVFNLGVNVGQLLQRPGRK